MGMPAEVRCDDLAERDASNGWTYQPSLDGLRAVAVVAVLVYHADERWLPGGFLGVSVFFTLSGFLITSLLLDEWRRTGRLDLRHFWSRRFRRLLPASWATIGLVVVLGAAGVWDDDQRRGLGGDATWAIAELANWRFIAQGADYGAIGSSPSPLQHLWSLAVEQQFYVVLPLLVAGVLAVAGRRRASAPLIAVAGVFVVLAAGSSTRAAVLSAADVERAYYGTDTRAAEMLVGAILATVLHGRLRGGSLRSTGAQASLRAVDVAVVGAIVALFVGADIGSWWLYPWGLLACAATTVAVIVRGLRTSAIRGALGWSPLVRLGRVSYGVYLLHWPLYLALSPARVGIDGVPLAVLRVVVTLAGATVLFVAVEQPVRAGRRLRGRVTVPVAITAATVLLGAAARVGHDAAPVADYMRPRAIDDLRVGTPGPTGATTTTADAGTSSAPPTRSRTTHAPTTGAPTTGTSATATPTVAPPTMLPPRTARRVLLVGDSVAASIETPLIDTLVRFDVAAASAAAPGCGVVAGFPTDEEGRIAEMTRPCNDAVPARQSGAVAMFRPDLVAVLSSWEIANRTVGDTWYRVGTPESDTVLRRLYGEMIDRLSSGGAVVALVLMPDVVDGRTQPARPEEVERNRHLNGLLTAIASERPGVVALPFHRSVCPTDPCPAVVEGIELRERDGRHFDGAASRWAALRLAELLLRLDLDQPRIGS